MAKIVNLSTRGRLYEPHARSYELLKIEVYLNHGWVLEPTNANGTTLRPYDEQVAIFKQNYTNQPNGSKDVRRPQWTAVGAFVVAAAGLTLSLLR